MMEAILITIIATSGASLLNFVATKIYNAATNSNKSFLWKEKKVDLKNLKSPFDFEEIKKRIRIIVIDDEPGFPLKLFQAEGYAIERWEKIESGTYGKLESGFYDIIILDIKGVANDISQDDGLGVLENIKRKNPSQIIIAFSQHSYDLDKTKFFVQADEYIAKPSDFLSIKNSIDNLVTTKYNPSRYIDSLHQLLISNNVKKSEITKLDTHIYNIAKKGEKADWKGILESSKGNIELIKQVMSLGNTILKFFQ